MTHFTLPPAIDKMESDFDRMLREANILIHHAHKYKMVEEWVRQNHRTRFVPEAILKAFHLDSD